MNYLTTEDGKPIKDTNRLPVDAKISESNVEQTNDEDIAAKVCASSR